MGAFLLGSELLVFAIMASKHSVESRRGAVLCGSNADCLLRRFHDDVTSDHSSDYRERKLHESSLM